MNKVSTTKKPAVPRPGLYLCSRTSTYKLRPCDEAFEVVLINTDTRSCDDPKKIPAHHGTNGDWYEKGTNHRVENGCIKRDMGTKVDWAVEIADLQKFVDKHGSCVISRDTDGFCNVEIYDSWRE